MFAVAVWDGERRRLVLARDRFGIKPLYYRDGPGEFAFASELKALRRLPSLSREVDLDALEAFLAFNAIHGPRTIFREVRKLPPGHVLVLEDGVHAARALRGARARPGGRAAPTSRGRRWPPSCASACATPCARTSSPTCRSACCSRAGSTPPRSRRSRRRRARAASRRSRSASRRRRSPRSSSRARSRERYGTDHHELVVEPDAVELLPTIAAAFDEPFADSSALPTYLVSELAAQHVKVALSGEGGDELFGGYETYVADLLALRAGGVARLLSPLAERLPSGSGRVPLDYKLKRFTRAAHLPPLERHHGWKEIFSADARAELLRPDRRGTRGPARRLPRPLGGDRGRRHARAAPGRRPRDLPRRRPARQDRPHEHGPLARAARAVPRPGGRRARARAAGAGAGPRLRQEAAAARGGRAARRARHRARAQEGLLDPRRRLAAR